MRLSLRKCLLVASVTVLAVSAPDAARGQVDSREGIALQNQMYQLRQELQILRDQVARGGGAAASQSALGGRYTPPPGGGDMVAQLLTRVDTMEEQVRQFRGRLDELQNQMQRQNADLGKRIDDLAFVMSNQGGGAAPARPTPAPPAPVAASPPQAPPPTPAARRTPEFAIQEGNAALARRDYAAAEAAAREVLANRTSPRAYDAQLLLAQALNGQRQYPQAAIAYDDAYNRNRKGPYAQDALLGLANALTAINEKRAACESLSRFRAEFPQPRADLRDAVAAAAQRAGCR